MKTLSMPRRALWAALCLCAGGVHAGCAPRVHWTSSALVSAMRADLRPPDGFRWALSYSGPNPTCWSSETAPIKPRRRLRRLAHEGIASGVQLCYAELVRTGTHDDILVKLFVHRDDALARRTLRTRFVGSRRARLARYGLPAPQRVGNVVFYVTGARANSDAIRRVWSAVRARLSRPPPPR